MNREIKVRLDSERKWGFISKNENNNFYKQNFLNKQIAENLAEKEAKSNFNLFLIPIFSQICIKNF